MKSVYRRMLQGLKTKVSGLHQEVWTVYILECADGTFYTGIAKDPHKRLKQHNCGKGARYTRARAPVRLVYQETCLGRSLALIRECAIKTLSRDQKLGLITSQKD